MKYGYNEKDEIVNENVTFTIKCTMRKRWAPQFSSMLKRMQYNGGIGRSREIAIYADGDGDFHPQFEFSQEFPEVEPISEHNENALYDAG